MVRPRFKVFWLSKDNFTGHCDRKKKRQTEEEMGRQYERMDRNGQEWTLQTQLGQLKTGQNGKGLRIHLWCSDNHPSYGID